MYVIQLGTVEVEQDRMSILCNVSGHATYTQGLISSARDCNTGEVVSSLIYILYWYALHKSANAQAHVPFYHPPLDHYFLFPAQLNKARNPAAAPLLFA